MLAYAFSGGGNRGALQVGAAEALLTRNLRPDLTVGASIGAVNAAFLASDPTPAGVARLADIWRTVRLEDVYPGGRKSALWRLLRGRPGLFSNANWHAFMARHAHVRYFGELEIPCYVIATDWATGRPKLFGLDPDDKIVDALMASTALPPYHPPWEVDGRPYVDGGTVGAYPVRVAAEMGADRIIGLNLINQLDPVEKVTGALGIANRAVGMLIQGTVRNDIAYLELAGNVALHTLDLYPERPLPMTDFSRMPALIDQGRRLTEEALEADPLELLSLREKVTHKLETVRRAVQSKLWDFQTA